MISLKVLDAVKSVLKSTQRVGLHEPIFQGNELKYLKDCIDTTFVSSVGKYVDQFEKKIASYVGCKRAVAVVNGTVALQMALLAVNVSKNNDVIVPSLTFVATPNAVSYLGATPYFCDSDISCIGYDENLLKELMKKNFEVSCGECRNKETGKKLGAIVVMHTFGHPSNIELALKLSFDFKVPIVEDAAESLGSFYQGKHTGTFGNSAAISFNGNKIITAGGGGVFLTNDEKMADHIKHITTTAKTLHKWEYIHDLIGYNFRMPNLNAALVSAQLEKIEDMVESKRKLFRSYKKAFASIDEVSIVSEPDGARSNYWLQTIILKKNDIKVRNKILTELNNHGYTSRPLWRPMHLLEPYKKCQRTSMLNCERIYNSLINIPSSAFLI
jgi:perosamine synthetase